MKNALSITSVVIVGLTISACSDNKTLEEHLSSANEYKTEQNYNEAVIELKNAVRLNPKSADARFMLGEAYLQQGNYVNAEKELARALSLGFNAAQVMTLQAQVYTKLNQADKVYDILEHGSALNDEQYILVLTYAGISSIGEGKIEAAQDYFGQAISINEANVFAQISKAYVEHSKQNYIDGIKVVDQILSTNANVSEALLLKGNFLYALNEFEEAAEVFALYIKQHPQAIYVKFFEIDSLIKADQLDAAEKRVDEVLKVYKQSALALQYKAQIKYQKKDYKAAKQFALLSAQQGTSLPLARLIAGISAYQLGEIEQAYEQLRALEPIMSSSHPAQRILAIVKLQLGYVDEASATISNIDNFNEDDTAYMQGLSLALLNQGEFKSAYDLVDKADELSPNNANIKAQKGILLLNENDLQGINALEQALLLDPKLVEVELSLALQYLKNNEDDKAQAIVEKHINSDIHQEQGYLLQGIIYSKHKKNEKAKQSFNKVLEINNENVAALYSVAQIAEQDGELEQAVNLYETLLNIQPNHIGALQDLNELNLQQDNISDSITFLSKLNKEKPNNVHLVIALAQNLRLDQQTGLAIEILESINTNTNLPVGYWVILGDTYLQAMQLVKADDTYAKAEQQYGKNYIIKLRRIGLLEMQGDYQQALTKTIQAYQQFPNDRYLLILLANYQLLNNNITETKKLLTQLKEQRIEHTLVERIKGQVAMLDKNYPEAIEAFTLVYQNKATGVNAIALAQPLAFNGDTAEAENLLEQYLEKNPTDLRVRILLAQLYAPDETEKKITQYQAILTDRPENISVLNNLAWNYYQQQNLTTALEYAQKAYQIAPENISIQETYGVILANTEQSELAQKVLQLAVDAGSKDAYVQVSLAKLFVKNNNFEQAELILNTVDVSEEDILQQVKALSAKIKAN